MCTFHDAPPRYRSYLLRTWEVRGFDPALPPNWRFSVRNADTGRARSFADLEALLAFLRKELAND